MREIVYAWPWLQSFLSGFTRPITRNTDDSEERASYGR